MKTRVWVLGEVYESDLPFVRTGQSAEIELPYSGGGRRIRGRVSFIYPFLDPKTRTVQLRMEFSNPDLSLKPEMFTNITFSVSIGRQVLIPQDALMDTGTEQYVFIDKGDERQMHLYLLSFERHAFVGHFVVEMPK